jgi:hypothetical protein
MKILVVSVLAASLALGAAVPALADGAASTRNIILGGAAAAVLIANYNHKKRIKAEEQREQTRRQEQYRQYYRQKYGHDPTDQQLRDWYYRTYGVYPS